MPCHYQDLGNTSDRSCREKHFLQPITNKRWFVGTKHAPESKNTSQNPKHFLQSKTRPRIQNTSQNPKTLPESKTRPRVQNTSLRESQKTSNNPKHIPKTKNTSKNLNASQKHFWIQERVLDSGTCFWILGNVLDSGTCFWILGSVLDSGTCLISNWPRTRELSQLLQAGNLLLTFLTMITRWFRSTSSFYPLIGQNLTGEFMR